MPDSDPVRPQYHLWPSPDGAGLDAWDVDRLILLTEDLPTERVALDSIAEIDTAYWSLGTGPMTVRQVADHAGLIEQADLDHPVILGWDGRVMDGMHRIAKALVLGLSEVQAVRLPSPVPPDRRNVTDPSTLRYDRPLRQRPRRQE